MVLAEVAPVDAPNENPVEAAGLTAAAAPKPVELLPKRLDVAAAAG